MNGSTTQGFCTSGAQKRSSTPDSHLTSCCRFSNRRCTPSQKPKRSVRPETTTLSYAGTGACACCKMQPTCGMYGKENARRSISRTHHRHNHRHAMELAVPETCPVQSRRSHVLRTRAGSHDTVMIRKAPGACTHRSLSKDTNYLR